MKPGKTSSSVELDRNPHEQSQDGAHDKVVHEHGELSGGGGHRSGSRSAGTSQAEERYPRRVKLRE